MSKLLKYESPAYKQKLKSYNYRQSEFSLKFDAEHRKADSKWDFRKPRGIYIYIMFCFSLKAVWFELEMHRLRHRVDRFLINR